MKIEGDPEFAITQETPDGTGEMMTLTLTADVTTAVVVLMEDGTQYSRNKTGADKAEIADRLHEIADQIGAEA